MNLQGANLTKAREMDVVGEVSRAQQLAQQARTQRRKKLAQARASVIGRLA